jgi:hypothetical protein
MAGEADVDLVEIAATANPPVCRLMDYGKFKYQEQKKAAEAKAKQTVIEIKEIKFRPGTDDGDYNIKLRNIRGSWPKATSARSRCASAAARSRTRKSAWRCCSASATTWGHHPGGAVPQARRPADDHDDRAGQEEAVRQAKPATEAAGGYDDDGVRQIQSHHGWSPRWR